MLLTGIIKHLVVFIEVRHPLWLSNIILLIPREEMVEMEIKVQIVLLEIVGIIPIDLLVDVMVLMPP